MRQAGGRLQSQIDADNKLKRIQKLNGTWTGGKGVENLLANLILGGFQMQEEFRCEIQTNKKRPGWNPEAGTEEGQRQRDLKHSPGARGSVPGELDCLWWGLERPRSGKRARPTRSAV